jgi:type VI secretion system secreted protein VgrG
MATQQRHLTVSGSFTEGELVVDTLVGHDDLAAPFELTLTLLSDKPDMDIANLVGDTMTLNVDIGGGQTRHFNGYVTRMTLVGTYDRHARYQATLRPWLWLMSSRVDSRIFQNKSIPDIAKALFREHGFSDFEDALTGTHAVREFVVQYHESDFSFVSRLFEKAGIYYYFRHEAKRHVLVLADSPSGHKAPHGYENVPFHPEGSPTPTSEESFNRWELVHQWRPGAYTANDYDFERPKADLTAKLQAQAKHKKGDLEIYDYPMGYLNSGEATAYVRARLEALQSDVEVVNASGDVRGLGSGDLFKLVDFPINSQNKQYLVVSMAYDAKNNSHDGGNDDAGHFKVACTVMDAKVPFRPAMTTPMPRIEGVQTALVVGKAGEEIWTDKYGRIKVQFHWDREGKKDENSSCWVRVAQLWAGSNWGGMHIPRIGQEVIIDFLEGDPDRPIVTGRVYNGNNMPPYDLPGNQTQSGIKSRSSKGGGPSNFNELRFEDKKGSELVSGQAEKDLAVLVKHDETRSVGHDRTTGVDHDEIVNVKNDRTETVGHDESITITNNRTESVGKAETVTIGTARTHKITTDESVTVGGLRTLNVTKDDTTSVGGKQVLSVAKDMNVDVGGVRTFTIAKDDTLNVDGKLSVTVAKDETRQSKKLTIKVGDQITIQTGSASITMKSNGDITIKGANITLDGSGKVNIKAGGDMILKGSKISEN